MLALTLAAVRWAGGENEPSPAASAVRETRSSPPRAAAAERVPELAVDRLGKRAPASSRRDIFPATSWEQQARTEQMKNAPRPPPPPPPPPPQAPPLPFTYMGKMIEDGRVTVFLVRGDRNFIARVGDTIEGLYRVERVDDRAILFTYLPLNQGQELSLGAV